MEPMGKGKKDNSMFRFDLGMHTDRALSLPVQILISALAERPWDRGSLCSSRSCLKPLAEEDVRIARRSERKEADQNICS